MKPWIENRITELIGVEDEILSNLVLNMLTEEKVDPKEMHINLTGFLEQNTAAFMVELWNLLESASRNIGGIPSEFVKESKKALEKEKEQQNVYRNRSRGKKRIERRHERSNRRRSLSSDYSSRERVTPIRRRSRKDSYSPDARRYR